LWGDRDKKKRSLMAKVANNYSKKIYVTDDNPRNEDPKKIRNEIIKKIDHKNVLILEIELKL
jgi:UDP-N-acetylmuramyl tripeptide synthase